MMGNRSRTADETDAAEHKNDLVFNHGRRGKIKRAARRSGRRNTRQSLRSGSVSD
jgi:hypothetical protein